MYSDVRFTSLFAVGIQKGRKDVLADMVEVVGVAMMKTVFWWFNGSMFDYMAIRL